MSRLKDTTEIRKFNIFTEVPNVDFALRKGLHGENT